MAMPFQNADIVSCDVLVIGGGGAGLRAAAAAREMGADVLIASRSRVGYGSNTYLAKASFAAATGWRDPRDNPEVHIRDTLVGGRFINDQKLVAEVAETVPAEVSFLEKCGVNFRKRGDKIQVYYTPGHSYPRHVWGKNKTGSDLTLPLRAYTQKIGVKFAEKILITKLLTSHGRIAGATGIDHEGRFLVFSSRCVVLATGGFAPVYLHNTNAAGINGDGYALAFELGIPLKDMEFVQFFPTALGNLGNRVLMYEPFVAVAGATLRNSQGDDIIVKHGLSDPMLMTRDRLSRAIMIEILEGRSVENGVIMDLQPVPEEKLAELRALLPGGASAEKKEFVVSPTAHFCMGGITIDKETETAIPGLFAAGEVSGGVHGANRLGGNALSEIFAMGGIAGKTAASRAKEMDAPEIPQQEIDTEKVRLESFSSGVDHDPRDLRRCVKELMWYKAGIIREEKGLKEALAQIEEFNSNASRLQANDFGQLSRSLELQHMLLVAEMVCRAALLRTESRGAHYRSDYPEEDNERWFRNIVIRKKDEKMILETVPVAMDMVIPERP